MGTMDAKEVGDAAAGSMTVQPFRYTEFAGPDAKPTPAPAPARPPATAKKKGAERDKAPAAQARRGRSSCSSWCCCWRCSWR